MITMQFTLSESKLKELVIRELKVNQGVTFKEHEVYFEAHIPECSELKEGMELDIEAIASREIY